MTSVAIEWIAATANPAGAEWQGEAERSSLSSEETRTVWDQQPSSGTDSDLWIYRDRTVAMLRKYERIALEVGRLPSLLGREFFRTQVTSYRAHTFEDSVIFVHDIERCLETLNPQQKKVIAVTVLQEYTHLEAANVLGTAPANVWRWFVEAVDRVSEIFLERKILERVPCVFQKRAKTCQEGKIDEFSASDSN